LGGWAKRNAEKVSQRTTRAGKTTGPEKKSAGENTGGRQAPVVIAVGTQNGPPKGGKSLWIAQACPSDLPVCKRWYRRGGVQGRKRPSKQVRNKPYDRANIKTGDIRQKIPLGGAA